MKEYNISGVLIHNNLPLSIGSVKSHLKIKKYN